MLTVLLAAPATAVAAGCPRASTTDIEDEVMCLQCGVPLNVSEDAPAAKRERAFIQSLVDRCMTKKQIKDALVAQFGDRILADPKDKTAWLVPVLGVGGGIVLISLAAWRWRRRRRSEPEEPALAGVALSEQDAARLEADLDRYDG
jgi:cytochrome c-type biogenesis protein CcmH/NrfF